MSTATVNRQQARAQVDAVAASQLIAAWYAAGLEHDYGVPLETSVSGLSDRPWPALEFRIDGRRAVVYFAPDWIDRVPHEHLGDALRVEVEKLGGNAPKNLCPGSLGHVMYGTSFTCGRCGFEGPVVDGRAIEHVRPGG